MSPLAIAEWIEIPSPVFCKTRILSPLAIAEWIEIMGIFCFITVIMSPLAIAEWIEILQRSLENERMHGLR